MCYNDTKININRKKSECKFIEVDISVLGDKIQNFIDYVNYINFDYGRIELLRDKHLGWCIIDVNNSPGKGPVTNMAVDKVVDIFRKIIQKIIL